MRTETGEDGHDCVGPKQSVQYWAGGRGPRSLRRAGRVGQTGERRGLGDRGCSRSRVWPRCRGGARTRSHSAQILRVWAAPPQQASRGLRCSSHQSVGVTVSSSQCNGLPGKLCSPGGAHGLSPHVASLLPDAAGGCVSLRRGPLGARPPQAGVWGTAGAPPTPLTLPRHTPNSSISCPQSIPLAGSSLPRLGPSPRAKPGAQGDEMSCLTQARLPPRRAGWERTRHGVGWSHQASVDGLPPDPPDSSPHVTGTPVPGTRCLPARLFDLPAACEHTSPSVKKCVLTSRPGLTTMEQISLGLWFTMAL